MSDNENSKSQKVIIGIVALIVGLMIGAAVFFFTDILWLRLLVSVCIIILSIVIIIRNIVKKKSN